MKMVDQEKQGISFGFSKKSEKKILKRKYPDDETNEKDETDYVISLEGQEVKSSKPKKEKKEFVIPLIKTNNWKTKHEKEIKNDAGSHGNKDELDSQAVAEIIQDAEKRNETWEERAITGTDREIPLLMQNQVPEGYENDDQLDVSLRPDEPEEAAYGEIPIEEFGMALLKGMGWKPGMGIGKNNSAVKPVDAVLRPKGMGLGADRKQAQDLNSAKQGGGSDKKQGESADLRLTKGAHCLVENGPNKDLYGVIEGLDEDNARLMVKLTISGKLVTISQYNIKLVSSDEYTKYSKYLNKGAADRYKEKEQKKGKHRSDDDEQTSDNEGSGRKSSKEKRRGKDRNSDKYKDSDHDSDRDRNRDRSHKGDKYRDSERESRSYKGEGQNSDRYKSDQNSDYDDGKRRREKGENRDSEERHKEKRERKKDKHREKEGRASKYGQDRSEANGSAASGPRSLWVRSNLRVRLVDEKYKKGKFFNCKLVIVDVFDRDHCVCKTEEGKVLEEISQKMLETVVPKTDSAYVCIVGGKYRGQLAHVMERNKKKYEATLQLLSDRNKVLQVDYDSICEYVGDINEEFDF